MSMRLDIESAKAVYRRAIDAAASDGEGIVWWTGVADERLQVIQAENTNAAAAVIEWWHHDWHEVSDTALAAASRIRRAARALKLQ